jgi:alpha-beta hydrolase superfamily lysophospholipase
MPTLILRGEFDGIAGMDDLLAFFRALPHPMKQFSVMQGISHASLQQKNYMMAYHLLQGFFEIPDPVYTAH